MADPGEIRHQQLFVDHPEMVLGKPATESTQYGREERIVAPIPGADLAEQLREAVTHIPGGYQVVKREADMFTK